MSLFNSVIPSFWQETYGAYYGTPQLAERVWVANRCQQLNAQQIAGDADRVPRPTGGGHRARLGVSSPDPNWYPNGIGDALHAIVDQLYGWGFSLPVRHRPVRVRVPAGRGRCCRRRRCQIRLEDGRRAYKLGEDELEPGSRRPDRPEPGHGSEGNLGAVGVRAAGVGAAGRRQPVAGRVSDGGIPQAVLKPQQRVTKEQAEEIQQSWAQAAGSRGAAPAIIPPNLEYEQLSFNPSDLALLETQEWNARVLATAYGVPSVLLNMALQGGLTYQNPVGAG